MTFAKFAHSICYTDTYAICVWTFTSMQSLFTKEKYPLSLKSLLTIILKWLILLQYFHLYNNNVLLYFFWLYLTFWNLLLSIGTVVEWFGTCFIYIHFKCCQLCPSQAEQGYHHVILFLLNIYGTYNKPR